MASSRSKAGPVLPEVDLSFFELFLPYELLLSQRRALVWGSTPDDELPRLFVGLFLVRLETPTGEPLPVPDDDEDLFGAHARALLRTVLRDSDIVGSLGGQEHLAVARDLDPHQAYTVAQRFLAAAGRSEILTAADVRTRVGYVVYPLSNQPNFPPQDWSILLDLARRFCDSDEDAGRVSGYGVLRGARVAETGIPETDLVPLIFNDPDSLVKEGIIRFQRIHLIVGS
jgi:hypothetical protein